MKTLFCGCKIKPKDKGYTISLCEKHKVEANKLRREKGEEAVIALVEDLHFGGFEGS